MKKGFMILSLLMSLPVLGGIAHAGQFGSIEPTAKEGKFSLGLGYFYSQETMKPTDDTLTTRLFGVDITRPGTYSDATVTQNQLYLQGTYAFVKDWEVYARFGATDLKVEAENDEEKGSAKPFGTLGVRGAFYKANGFSIGAFAQGSYTFAKYSDSGSYSYSVKGINYNISESGEIKNMWDVNFGITLQYNINKMFTVYAGPFVYWKRASFEYSYTVSIPVLGTDSSGDSGTYKEKNNFGGFLGFKVPVADFLSIEVEGQMKDKVSAGASISYRF